jgi:cytochrome c oxidase subunit II
MTQDKGLHMLLKKPLLATFAGLALLFAASAFAGYDVDILPPASAVATEIYDLHWKILYVCVAIFVIVFGAMFWSLFMHRRAMGAKAAQFHENTTVEILWTVVPFVILIGMAYPATRTILDMKDASNPDMSIKVTAFQWGWDYDYLNDGVRFTSLLSTPRNQIEDWDGKAVKERNEHYLLEVNNNVIVPVGKKVRLLITSNDVIHGWYVPQLGINQYGIPGFVKDAWFKAEKVGIFRGQCSQICGKEHGFMPIVVEVVTVEKYADWVKGQKAKMPAPVAVAAAPAQAAAAPPEDPNKKWTLDDLKAKGAEVYAANCVACHQATGKGVPPAFPPLDGSKIVTGPKAAQIAIELNGKPNTAMAPFSRLSDVELAAVITHTRNSWGNKTGEAIQPSEIKAARK